MHLLPLLLAQLVACGNDVSVTKSKEDNDGDGYAAEVDCDDAHATANPDGVEVCDGLDNDCDGVVDDAPTDGTTTYADTDGDGHGDGSTAVVACSVDQGRVTAGDDCDDADATSFPGGTEVCDSADNDCDGTVDDGATDVQVWFADTDEDGHGDAAASVEACEAPAGHVASDDDCDDADARVYPDAVEDDCADPKDYNCDGSVAFADADGDGWAACQDCDDTTALRNPGNVEACDAANVDEDCDGSADDLDDDATAMTTFRRDADGDGYANPVGAAVTQCDAPLGYAATATDCDDLDPTVSPGASEICDPFDTDEDCDGMSDDADASTAASSWTAWYRDRDGDGYGETARAVNQCEAPTGYVATGGDCDDSTAARSPGRSEICDSGSVDEDCDGLANDADGSVTGRSTYYADIDGDGYGTTTGATSVCTAPAGYVTAAGDCDDARSAVNPGATEACDALNVDEDCDGVADDLDTYASGRTSSYRDVDGDGYGTGSAVASCDVGTGYVTNATDCNDAVAGISPAATEVCDASNVDEDCDGRADDADSSVTGRGTWYRDADSDGFGSASMTTAACDQPSGYVATATDCDDGSGAIRPGGTEMCDASNLDEDCDGTADDADTGGATGKVTAYRDVDGDGYGTSGVSVEVCDLTTGYALVSTDCNDAVAAINPGATEVCDAANTDEDCDGLVNDADSGVTGATWYLDADGDGYGLLSSTSSSCSAPAGYAATAGDCNDGSAAIRPSASEVCDAANVDEDCDGLADDADTGGASGKVTVYRDADGDTYGTTATTLSVCDLTTGYVTTSGDCNDASASIRPGATELCDASNVDEDCDGAADDADTGGASGASTWYRDADSDGYGTSGTSTSACDLPTGYLAAAGDCNDANAAISPGDAEVCANSIDDDCDGTADDGCITAGFSGSYGVNTAFDTKFYGQYANDQFGYDIVAGDFNGDGRGDLIVGAPSSDTYASGYGSAYIFYGAFTTGVSTVTSSSLQFYNNSSSWGGTWAGKLWNVGDLNGDGRPEPMISAQNSVASTSYAYGYYGGDTTSKTYSANDFSDNCFSVAPGGDFNSRSGTDEFVCGRSDTSSGTGSVRVYSGAPTTTLVAYFTGESMGDYAGYSVAGGQDIDGDGYDDLVIGATGDDDAATDAGAAYVIFAPISSTTGSPFSLTYADAKIRGAVASDNVGARVEFAGDINSDGYADVAVANPGYDATSRSGSGAIGIWTGLRAAKGASAPPVTYAWATANVTVIGEDAGDQIGSAFSFGDVNGDGVRDLLVGSSNNDDTASNAGSAWLVYGALSGTIDLATAADAEWLGTNTSDGLGRAVAIVPDMNGDGAAELAMSAVNGDERGYTNYGAVWVWLGQ